MAESGTQETLESIISWMAIVEKDWERSALRTLNERPGIYSGINRKSSDITIQSFFISNL